MGIINKIDNRYWIDHHIIYRVSSFHGENYGCTTYKIIVSYFENTDDPTNTDVIIYAATSLSNEDVIILDKLANRGKKRNRNRVNNIDSRGFNSCKKIIKKESAIGKFINKLTDIANFKF